MDNTETNKIKSEASKHLKTNIQKLSIFQTHFFVCQDQFDSIEESINAAILFSNEQIKTEASEASQQASGSQAKKRGRKKRTDSAPGTQNSTITPQTTNSNPNPNPNRALSEISIFSNDFIEHSKSREQESRLLRKEVNELEQQNGVLIKHIESLKKSTTSAQSDVDFYRCRNEQLKKLSENFRQLIVKEFQSRSLPGDEHSCLSLENIDDFVRKLTHFVKENRDLESGEDDDRVKRVREFSEHLRSVLAGFNLNGETDL